MDSELQGACGMELSELKSPSVKDDPRIAADLPGSPVQCSRLSSRGSDRTGSGDNKLYLSNDDSCMENCLKHPQNTSKSLPLDLALQSTDAPVEQRLPVRAEQEDVSLGVHGNRPVCTQLSASTQPQTSLCPTHKSYRFHHHHHQSQEMHSSSSKLKTQPNLKTIAAHNQQVASDDPCASLVLACLFCQLEDCLVAVGDGCQLCVGGMCSSLCSNACCCDPSSLEPFLEACPNCDPASCLDAHCCLCRGPWMDSSACDFCFHATECLELGMEVSQLLFH